MAMFTFVQFFIRLRFGRTVIEMNINFFKSKIVFLKLLEKSEVFIFLAGIYKHVNNSSQRHPLCPFRSEKATVLNM